MVVWKYFSEGEKSRFLSSILRAWKKCSNLDFYPKKWLISKQLVSFEKFRTLAFQQEVLRYCSTKIVFTVVFKKMGKCQKSRIFYVFFRFSYWHSKFNISPSRRRTEIYFHFRSFADKREHYQRSFHTNWGL